MITKFTAFYNLCPIHDAKDFLGFSEDRDKENVIATVSQNVVLVIKVNTQKQVHSWSTHDKLSSKVVYDKTSDKYYGVFGNSTLRSWDENMTDVNKSKKFKFKRSIADLITTDYQKTFVLFYDGTVQELSTALTERKNAVTNTNSPSELKTNRQFINATIKQLPDESEILYYFKQNQTGGLSLIQKSLQNNLDSIEIPIARGSNDVHVSGYAIIEGDSSPTLVTIWSDKRVFLLPLNDDSAKERSPGNFVSTFNAVNVEAPLVVLGLSKNVLAIYGSNIEQEGGSLLLYNTQFKIVKAKQYFKVYFEYTRLWSVGEHILLAIGQNLSVVSYHMSKDLLSHLIGTQNNDDMDTQVECDHINEEEFLEEQLRFVGNISGIADKEQEEYYEETNWVADGKVVPFESAHYINENLDDLCRHHLHVELVEVEKGVEDAQIELMSNYNDNGFRYQEVAFLAKDLERFGACEYEITEKLLTLLIKSDLIEDIENCLRRYSNISEKILAKTLNYLLGKVEISIENKSQLKRKPTDESEIYKENENKFELIESEQELPPLNILEDKYQKLSRSTSNVDVLNLLLAQNFDSTVITSHIRREVDYEKLLLLLEHLYRLITSEEAVFEDKFSPEPECIKFEIQVFRWFGVLINAHFQKLAISKDNHLIEQLLKWHSIFSLYKKDIAQLDGLAAILYNLVQQKHLLRTNNYSKWYSIEEVKLY